jgi:hypothetical protein
MLILSRGCVGGCVGVMLGRALDGMAALPSMSVTTTTLACAVGFVVRHLAHHQPPRTYTEAEVP